MQEAAEYLTNAIFPISYRKPNMETDIGVGNTAHCTIGHVSQNSRNTEYFLKQHKPNDL